MPRNRAPTRLRCRHCGLQPIVTIPVRRTILRPGRCLSFGYETVFGDVRVSPRPTNSAGFPSRSLIGRSGSCRRSGSGTMTGSNETPTPGGRCCPAGVWRSGRRNHVSANGCSRAQAEDCVTDLVDQLPVGLPDPGVAGQLSPWRQGTFALPGLPIGAATGSMAKPPRSRLPARSSTRS